jgi:hypothetical protein
VTEEPEKLPYKHVSLLKYSMGRYGSMNLTYHAAGIRSFSMFNMTTSSSVLSYPTFYFLYDEQGRFIGFEKRLSDKTETVIQEASVSYKEEMRQVEIAIRQKGGGEQTILFQYDEAGKNITEVLNAEALQNIRYHYQYDDSGRISVCDIFYDNAQLSHTYVYAYGMDGAMLSYEQQMTDIGETYQYTCEINDLGQVTQTRRQSEAGGLTSAKDSSTQFSYEELVIPAQMVTQINLQLCLLDVLGYLSYPVLVQTDGLSSIF